MGTNVAWSGVDRRVTADRRAAAEEVETGSMAVAVGGGAAVVLTILALIGVLPEALTAIAAIVLGGGLLLGSAAIGARSRRAIGVVEPLWARHEILGGLGTAALASVASIALGIIALAGTNPLTLVNCAAIVLGAGLIFAAGSLARVDEMARRTRLVSSDNAGTAVMMGSMGTEALVGVGAIVLGIIGLAGHAPLIMATVAFLSLGGAAIMSGSTVAARVFSFLS